MLGIQVFWVFTALLSIRAQTLKMETLLSLETSENTNPVTQCHIPHDLGAVFYNVNVYRTVKFTQNPVIMQK